MKSKAISPMIAVVLLIAFTIAVGGILSLWLTGFATTTTQSVETASLNQTKCVGTYIDIISVTSSAVIITNRGTQTINSPICYFGNGTLVDNMGSTLTSGASNSSTNGPGTGTSASTSVLCSGDCLNIGVTGECKSGQSCWK